MPTRKPKTPKAENLQPMEELMQLPQSGSLKAPEIRFLHLSDLHYHSSSADNQEADALLAYVSKNYPEHRLIITGDIVDDGIEAQYDNAFAALSQFLGRVYIAPGNHDFGAAGLFYSNEKAKRFDERLSGPLKQSGMFFAENLPVVHLLTQGGTQVMLIALDTNL